jgi:hypothetical protein
MCIIYQQNTETDSCAQKAREQVLARFKIAVVTL